MQSIITVQRCWGETKFAHNDNFRLSQNYWKEFSPSIVFMPEAECHKYNCLLLSTSISLELQEKT